MQSIYVTSKAFIDAIAKIPATKSPMVHPASSGHPDRMPPGRSASYDEETQRAVESSTKIFDSDGSIKGAIDDLIGSVCRDYKMTDPLLVAAGHSNIYCFNAQYVLLVGTDVQRIYALRKSPGRKIKNFSCFLPRYPGSYLEVNIRLGKKEKPPHLEAIFDKYTEKFGPSLLAIYPKLDGCAMELSHDHATKSQLKDLFTDFGVNASFYGTKDWGGASTGTPAISQPFASTSNAVASATLDDVKEEEGDGLHIEVKQEEGSDSDNIKEEEVDESFIEAKKGEGSDEQAALNKDALKDRLVERSEQIARDVERLRSAYQADVNPEALNMLQAAEALEIHAAAFAEIVKDL